MEINTTRFGLQQVNPESVIEFPEGLPGLEGNTRFQLFHQGDDPALHYLQSLDDADLTLGVADPARFGIAYEFSLDDREMGLLKATPESPLLVLVILYLAGQPGGEEITPQGYGPVRGNLRGPLVINPEQRLGVQKLIGKLGFTTVLQEID